MWFVKYGKEYLHDPRVGLALPTATIETEVNASDYFKFTIAGNSELASKLKEHDQERLVTVLSDDVIVFRGEITNISSDFQTTKTVECRGELAYLNDTLVRPYSTLAGESSRKAPASVDGYFAFLVEEHNSQVEAQKRFTIDINEGAYLDRNNYIYRSDSTYPSVGKTIKEKVIESLGGYLQLDYSKDTPHISLLADFPKVNAQVIDFGINLLDFVEEADAADVATFVVPVGKEIERESVSEGEVQPQQVKLTISGEKDGKLENGYFKSGDLIYSEEGVKRYGWIGAVVEYSDVEVASNLVSKGLLALKDLESPNTTIKVKAIDLSMIKPNYEPITIGQYVRVRSKPHNFDSYMLCSKVDYDLNSPDNDTFTLGTTFDTITGQQNKRINALNATINTVYEAADKISAEAKASATIAGQAKDTAEEAKEKAGKAVLATVDEYVVSSSSSDPPESGWSEETPEWQDDQFYIWRRTKVTYGDGSIVYGNPAVMTGNSGKDGADAILLRIDSSRGTVFKNNTVSTVLTARIFYGEKRIETKAQLTAAFGAGAYLEWAWLRMEDEQFGVISSTDSRISQDGFCLTVSPDDVNDKTTFTCELKV